MENHKQMRVAAESSSRIDLVIENLDEYAADMASNCWICAADYVIRTPAPAIFG
jgi:hypothetical protein